GDLAVRKRPNFMMETADLRSTQRDELFIDAGGIRLQNGHAHQVEFPDYLLRNIGARVLDGTPEVAALLGPRDHIDPVVAVPHQVSLQIGRNRATQRAAKKDRVRHGCGRRLHYGGCEEVRASLAGEEINVLAGDDLPAVIEHVMRAVLCGGMQAGEIEIRAEAVVTGLEGGFLRYAIVGLKLNFHLGAI